MQPATWVLAFLPYNYWIGTTAPSAFDELMSSARHGRYQLPPSMMPASVLQCWSVTGACTYLVKVLLTGLSTHQYRFSKLKRHCVRILFNKPDILYCCDGAYLWWIRLLSATCGTAYSCVVPLVKASLCCYVPQASALCHIVLPSVSALWRVPLISVFSSGVLPAVNVHSGGTACL